MLFSTSLFSQIQINNVREGFYYIYSYDSIQLGSGRTTELETQQGLLNYQLETGKKGYYIPPNFRIDITGNKYIDVTDVLTISGNWHIIGDNGNYFRYINAGDIIKIEADSVMNWQRDIEVIRTKTFGKTEYALTDKIPFQIRDGYIYDITETSAKVHINITKKQSEIRGYIDNVLVREFKPGTSYKLDELNYWFYFNIYDLEAQKTYILRVEVVSVDKEINFIEYNIKTL